MIKKKDITKICRILYILFLLFSLHMIMGRDVYGYVHTFKARGEIMGQMDKLNENIEELRAHLNGLIEKGIKGSELLLASKKLDKLLVEYYAIIQKPDSSK